MLLATVIFLCISVLAIIVYYLLLTRFWGFRWARLIPSGYRPEILDKRHTDWLIFKWFPRDVHAFLSEKEPIMLIGNVPEGNHLDMIPKGTWCITFPFFFVVHFNNGFNVRFGDRYDYVDRYYVPFEVSARVLKD